VKIGRLAALPAGEKNIRLLEGLFRQAEEALLDVRILERSQTFAGFL
jgi:hypothetical protein